jgi:hypothetical protein
VGRDQRATVGGGEADAPLFVGVAGVDDGCLLLVGHLPRPATGQLEEPGAVRVRVVRQDVLVEAAHVAVRLGQLQLPLGGGLGVAVDVAALADGPQSGLVGADLTLVAGVVRVDVADESGALTGHRTVGVAGLEATGLEVADRLDTLGVLGGDGEVGVVGGAESVELVDELGVAGGVGLGQIALGLGQGQDLAAELGELRGLLMQVHVVIPRSWRARSLRSLGVGPPR